MIHFDKIAAAISNRTARVCVIGQGYVGLPLAVGIAQRGFLTYGLETDPTKVEALRRGESYVDDIKSKDVAEVLTRGVYRPTMDPSVLAECDVVIVCVPTPLGKSKDPDMSFIHSAVSMIRSQIHSGMLVILESTTYPGTTDEIIASELESDSLELGRNLFVCFSPERVDPGNPHYKTTNTPKVIGGVTPRCADLGERFYGQVMDCVVRVSSARVAEMVKLLENTFRAVNIGLVNEMALMSERMGIDIWEVINAAATKPFGFMPFYPGPGIGGHCIPLDPHYLAWKARSFDFYNKFIEVAADINGNMPRHVLQRISEALNLVGKSMSRSRVLVLGVAYKKNINDWRESPGFEIFKLLRSFGAETDYNDPFCPEIRDGALTYQSVDLDRIPEYDIVVLATDHSAYEPAQIARRAKLIFDTRNLFRGMIDPKILRLGVAMPQVADFGASESYAIVDGDVISRTSVG